MKAFTYKPSDVGLDCWPSGELRLEGIIPVTDPSEADVFIVPGNLSIFKDDLGRLDRLPYMAGRESRHVVFDVSDNFTEALCRNWIIIRCDARQWMMQADPNTIQFAWPVEDYAECVEIPEGGFKYDVSFQGWLSTNTRIDSSASCLAHPSLTCDIRRYDDFTGYIYHEPEGIRRRAEFRRSMRESRVCLCPESIPGVLPYRFFEAMSAGRVPVLVSSDFVLPLDDAIDYREFCLFISREEASKSGAMIREFLDRTPDDRLIEMGLAARDIWVDWLNCKDWPITMAIAVEKQLKKQCASR